MPDLLLNAKKAEPTETELLYLSWFVAMWFCFVHSDFPFSPDDVLL